MLLTRTLCLRYADSDLFRRPIVVLGTANSAGCASCDAGAAPEKKRFAIYFEFEIAASEPDLVRMLCPQGYDGVRNPDTPLSVSAGAVALRSPLR